MPPLPTGITRTQWDSDVFGIDTYEIARLDEKLIRTALARPGHYTIRVEPLAPKGMLQRHGFYYCDTLVEPFCRMDTFVSHPHEAAEAGRDIDIEEAARMIKGAFIYGRFHRDFNIEDRLADIRYERWLRQLHTANTLLALRYEGEMAGFLGYTGNRIALHALAEPFRGRGIAKYLWSASCHKLFAMGHEELVSSVSAANSAVMNLYSSLGFRFRKARDIYHAMVKK